MRVLICGAGIAGLTAAIALRREGIDVHVVEQASQIRSGGAGLLVASNALNALARIDVHPRGRPFSALRLADARDRTLSELPSEGVAVRRSTLHAQLVAHAPRVHTSTTLVAYNHGQAVLSDGRVVDCDRVIGAEGIGSPLRRARFSPRDAVPVGLRCWRRLVPRHPHTPDHPVEYWGGAARAGVVPLTEATTYVYLCLSGAPPDDALPTAFASFPKLVRAAIADRTTVWHRHDLAEHPEHHWVQGRVVLIGDASHALTPNLGQGAGMAIEDAVSLAHALAGGTVADWQRRRAARVAWVAQQSRQVGRVAHWRWPWAQALRNAAMRALPRSAAGATQRRLAAWTG